MVKSGPSLGDGGGIGQHADCSLHLREVAAWDDGGRLVIDANLESSWAPVDELDRPLALDGGNGSVYVLWHHIAPVEHAARHVLAVAWIALNHGVRRLEAGVSDLPHIQALVVSFLGRDDGSVGDEREVDAH